MHARVLDMNARAAKDLGSFASRCRPWWASADRLWILDQHAGWQEVDVSTGQPTGKHIAVNASSGATSCGEPPRLSLPTLRSVRSESTELRVAQDL
jgi:hypothetical protein